MNDSIAKLTTTLSDYKSKELPAEAVSKELFAQYSHVTSLSLTRGSTVATDGQSVTEQIIAFVTSDEPLTEDQQDRIEGWLKVRLENENVLVVINDHP